MAPLARPPAHAGPREDVAAGGAELSQRHAAPSEVWTPTVDVVFGGSFHLTHQKLVTSSGGSEGSPDFQGTQCSPEGHLAKLENHNFWGTHALGQTGDLVLLWMVAKSVSHHLETMVETIPFVGVYAGESSETRVSEQWCEMDFVHPQ